MSEKQALIPRLRFPEFWDAGEWRLKKLGDKDVSSFVKKRVPVNDLDLVSYVSTENILPDFGGIKVASKLPPSGSFTSYKPKDILIANIRPYLKKVWVADRCGAASNDVIVVRPMQGVTDSFLSAHLKSEHFIDHVMKGAKGVKMPRGDIFLIKEYPLAVPDSKEQQKIADCLSSLDELIAAQADKIDALKSHKKGLIQQLFPREVETVPRLRFAEFRDVGEWGLTNFYDLLKDVIDFRGRTPKKLGMDWGGGDIISLSANNVKNGYIDLSAECNLGSPELYEKWMGGVNLENGDIVFTMEAPLGNALLVPDSRKYILSQRVVAFKTKPSISNRFLIQLIWSPTFQSELEKLSTGSAAKGINQKTLKTVDVLVPKSEEEQQKIADCLYLLDELIAAQTEKLDTLKTHKKGLIQQLFPSLEVVDA